MPTALNLLDNWLRDPAIRRTILLCFLAGLTALVLIAILGAPYLLGVLAGPLLMPLRNLARRRRHTTSTRR